MISIDDFPSKLSEILSVARYEDVQAGLDHVKSGKRCGEIYIDCLNEVLKHMRESGEIG